MKASDIRNMTDVEIEHKVRELKAELFDLRNELQTGHVERPGRIRSLRRDVARCFTILKEKQSG